MTRIREEVDILKVLSNELADVLSRTRGQTGFRWGTLHTAQGQPLPGRWLKIMVLGVGLREGRNTTQKLTVLALYTLLLSSK